jgi:hypothetical protein
VLPITVPEYVPASTSPLQATICSVTGAGQEQQHRLPMLDSTSLHECCQGDMHSLPEAMMMAQRQEIGE